MGPRVSTFALLVLLLVAAGDAHHKSSHATRHGGRVRAAHRAGKASPVARSKGASEEPLLVTIKAAKELEYDFGDDGTLEKEMKATGRYDPKTVVGYDVTLDDHQRNRIFVTTPLVRHGIPATLSTIPYDGEQSPRLKPYPSLEIHLTTQDSITDCSTQLVDVIRTTVSLLWHVHSGNVLSVTDLTTGASKHLQSQYFHPKPGFFFTKAGGPAYYLPDRIDGVTADENCDGKLYFQAFTSNIQGVVDKQVIRDACDADVLGIKTQVNLPGEIPGQSGAIAVDPKGQLLFFPLLEKLAIYFWDTSKPHDPKNFRLIVQNDEHVQYISSINIDTKTERLYVTSDRLTSYLSNTTNCSEDNFQILYIDIKNIEC
ncbi:protein yellow-like [Schistocerca cancellata]|uniref:protein yellow-like n=1 Tax=Schistocerca cancellata TaxID=274614 RepID=UPI002118821D|nr:protein yellow-like [Schistocerca cancellata]